MKKGLAMVGLEEISHGFKSQWVLKEISFEVFKGQILSIVGANGAGKTTLLKIISGSLKPKKGRVVRRKNLRIAWDSPSVSLYQSLTVLENLTFFSSFHESKIIWREKLGTLGLLHLAEKRMDELSWGQGRLISLVRALTSLPSLCLLDEPFSGLDEIYSEKVSVLMDEQMKAGGAVVFTSHRLNHLTEKLGAIKLNI